MDNKFEFRIPMFNDKDKFIEYQYLELGERIESTLCGYNGTPQQYIGVKDINNKSIFVGDIVKDVFDSIFVISYNNNFLAYMLKDKQNNLMVFYPDIKLEVIGNIYENNNLLEIKNGDNEQ